jgi:excisionase family DNA binding protein
MAERSHRLLLTVNEAAALLGIKRTKLYELPAVGALASVRIGSSRRVPVAALEAYVEGLLRGRS